MIEGEIAASSVGLEHVADPAEVISWHLREPEERAFEQQPQAR
jgi:hypothetical protein